jgi:hypothetical protein
MEVGQGPNWGCSAKEKTKIESLQSERNITKIRDLQKYFIGVLSSLRVPHVFMPFSHSFLVCIPEMSGSNLNRNTDSPTSGFRSFPQFLQANTDKESLIRP